MHWYWVEIHSTKINGRNRNEMPNIIEKRNDLKKGTWNALVKIW